MTGCIPGKLAYYDEDGTRHALLERGLLDADPTDDPMPSAAPGVRPWRAPATQHQDVGLTEIRQVGPD